MNYPAAELRGILLINSNGFLNETCYKREDFLIYSGRISRVKLCSISPPLPSDTATVIGVLPANPEGTFHLIAPVDESMVMPAGADLRE